MYVLDILYMHMCIAMHMYYMDSVDPTKSFMIITYGVLIVQM